MRTSVIKGDFHAKASRYTGGVTKMKEANDVPPLFFHERFFFACFAVSTLSFAISASALETVGLATSWLTLFCRPFFDIVFPPFFHFTLYSMSSKSRLIRSDVWLEFDGVRFQYR